ncbi:DUF58 domain-containing protein [Cohnella nanjingensis]|uniref:DUF58 domain-containing protein n=1 Tax=Cohnella nanjingensis TaxID=1387779 RepID=A0A7X0VHI6_9BACL|nr:DUF58 domain-containing protein [Cohnella nanjingensis]MBB6673931.1 DUF58 domain-containing protein [Cohnella nanjingensis]
MMRLPIPRFGWVCAVLYVVSLMFVVFQGGKTSLMLFVMINALGAYLLLGRWSGIGGVRGARSLDGTAGASGMLSAGSRIRVRLQMQIPGFWPLPYIIVREKLARATGSETQEYELSFVPDYRRRGAIGYETAPLRRGRYQFLATHCSTRDIFGLFEHKGSFSEPLALRVMPRTIDLLEWRHMKRSRTGAFQQKVTSLWARETTQIDGVREYIHGDRMSRVHWNATARTGQWKSKEYEREALPRFVLVLDCRQAAYRTADGFELAVSVAASLLELALRRGMPVGFVSAGAKRAWFGAGRAPVTREQIMDHLIDIEADGQGELGEVLHEAAERFETGANLVLISPSTDDSTAVALDALDSRRIAPSHVHIAERAPTSEDSRRLGHWSRLFQAKHWEVCTVARLEDLPRAMEAGSA